MNGLTWILWSGAISLLLVQTPRPPRTASASVPHFIQAMTPVMAAWISLTLLGLLGMILCRHADTPLSPWRSVLILVTVTSIGLIPVLFQARRPWSIPLKTVSVFIVGIAWASCWPVAIAAAREGNPIFFLLGAMGGLLPDTLDHWVARFLHRTDVHIVPDPIAPDPKMIAGALADAITRCHVHRKPIRVQFYPVEIRANHWQAYTLRLDNGDNRIMVSLAGTKATAPIPVAVTTDHTFTLVIHNKPVSLEIAPTADGRVILRVMPWKQQWSHSLAAAAGLGALAWAGWGFYAGLAMGGAYALHLLTDQLGFTGSNLFFPFTRHRANGLQMLHPRQAKGFCVCVIWAALLLTGWNWARALLPTDRIPSLVPFLIFAGAIPMAGLVWLGKQIRPSR